jgi:hypothetical protein
MFAARITSGVCSLGESTLLLPQSLDMESEIPLSTPAINSTLNENSAKAISHQTIIGLELCEIRATFSCCMRRRILITVASILISMTTIGATF